jgi:hypothetical protein
MKRMMLVSILTSGRKSAQLFTVIAICCTVSRVYGIDDASLFGMVGGTFGEVIRLNAVRPPLVSGITPGPCILALGFADSAGTAVGNTVTADLGPGEAAFAELDFSSLAIRGGQRLELRPVATAAYVGSASGCSISAEVYDQSTGRTTVYARTFLPPIVTAPGDAKFGITGGAIGQVMRLNVVGIPPGPCRAVLAFALSNGTAVGPSYIANLTPGRATFLDLPMSAFALTYGQRVEIRPVVHTEPTTSWCAASAELWDQASGRTVLWEDPSQSR